jgi:hypothetical protein
LRRERLGLAKSMLAVERMAAQQQRLGAVGLERIERQGALFSHGVVSGIETFPGLAHIKPAQALKGGVDVSVRSHLLLKVPDLFVQPPLTRVWSQRDLERADSRR